jgi:hypothetical protein
VTRSASSATTTAVERRARRRTDIEPIKQLFEESTPDVVAAYDRVATAEPELAGEAATLSDFTEAAAEASKDANDLGELVTAILGLPGRDGAGQPASRSTRTPRRTAGSRREPGVLTVGRSDLNRNRRHAHSTTPVLKP